MPRTTIICPHCGDRTEQDVVLDSFTCGACDQPFSPEAELDELLGKRGPPIEIDADELAACVQLSREEALGG